MAIWPTMTITELKMNVTPCRLDQQQSSWMSHKRVLPEDERRELRIWMRRKQRESLAVYQKHRESLRERERKPFSTSGTTVSYVWLFAKIYTPCCSFLKYHVHIFVPRLCLCRNQQTRIEQPFGELERKKKSMYFFTLSGYHRCPHVQLQWPFDLTGSCFWSNMTRGLGKPVPWSVTSPQILQLT